jgi:hypothetical protein
MMRPLSESAERAMGNLGFAVFAAFLLSLVVWAATSQPPTPRPTELRQAEQQQSGDQPGNNTAPRDDHSSFKWWGPNWILCFITAVLAVFTYRQWEATAIAAKAAKSGADTARDTLHLTQRAWLHVTALSIEQFGKGPVFVIRVVNSGHLAGAVASVMIVMADEPLETPRPDSNPPCIWLRQQAAAPPNTPCYLRFDDFTALPPETWQGFASGKIPLSVFGALRYDAGFGVQGETGFGSVFSPKTFPGLPIGNKFASTDIPGYNYAF